MRKGKNECRNESPGGGCTREEKVGGGGKQSFKAGTSQLQGESLSSGQGGGHPVASAAWMPKLAQCQPSPKQLHCLVELQRQPRQEE